MATINVSDLNRQGKVFVAANVSTKNFVAVSTTATGLMVYNPFGSGVKVVLIDASFQYVTGPTAVTQVGIAVMNSNTAVPTSLTVSGRSAVAADGSGNVPKAIAWDAATLPAAPVAVRWSFGSCGTAVTTAALVDRIDGSIILVPGALAILCGLTTTAAGVGAFTWTEVPV